MKNGKILLIDDDENILEAIRIILELEGFEVETDNGSGVLSKLKLFQPNLVLLDVLLGGINGLEICRSIKSGEQKNTPVILISAHAKLGKNYKKFGAEDFIAKPFEIEELVEKIKGLL